MSLLSTSSVQPGTLLVPTTNDCNIFLFVVWAKARKFESTIRERLKENFKILFETDVRWPRWGFERKLFRFYQFGRWFTWWNKARKCGRGPFRVIVIEDRTPVWTHRRDTRGQDLVVDDRVYQFKKKFRKLTSHSNIVHSSVTKEETEQQLIALFGCGTEDFLANVYEDRMECLGEGHRRSCYRLRGSRNCLKAYLTDDEIQARTKRLAAAGRSAMRKSVLREIKAARFQLELNTCAQEFRSWQDLRQRLPASLMQVFPEDMCLLFDRTLGWCIQESMVLNPDDTVPHTFLHVVKQVKDEALRTRMMKAFCDLRDDLCAHRVRFFDPPNVLLQWLPGGDFRLRIVDMEPVARTWIPIENIFPFLVSRKTRRRFDRCLEHLANAGCGDFKHEIVLHEKECRIRTSSGR